MNLEGARVEHLKLIQGVVDRLSRNSFAVKSVADGDDGSAGRIHGQHRITHGRSCWDRSVPLVGARCVLP